MGFSLKKVVKSLVGGSVGKVAGSALGALVGGPEGAGVGYSLGDILDSNHQANQTVKDAKNLYNWQLGQETDNNIRLWNMNNEYNTPKNQMLRFVEAHLNPNLIYGQTNTASPISTASANFSLDNTQSARNLSNYLALSNLGIQKDLSSAQVRNIDNSIDMSKANLQLAKDRLALDRDKFNLEMQLADSGWLGSIIGRRRSSKVLDWLENYIHEF